jgi:hypothetical protein
MLRQRPTELLWPGGARAERHWTWNPELEELWVQCQSTGLLRVGSARHPGYKLQVDINQSTWTGGVGVFFGYGEDVYNGAPCVRYQYIELRTYLPHDPQRAFALWRGVEYVVAPGQSGSTSHREELMSVPLPVPNPRDQKLEVEVGPLGLVRVRWAGQEMEPLTAPDVNARLKPAGYVGEFGTLNDSSAAVFRQYQVMVLGAEPR